VIQPDARLAGGLSDFLRISAFADAMGCSVSSHGDQQLHCGVMAVIRNPSLAEYIPDAVDPWLQELYLDPVQPDADGHLPCRDTPGAGWDIDAQAMSRFRLG
jgi:L-alanine-DL-glutamate epimerase-like enolase superfamily enzyme